jgi:hypothetical protein
MTPRNESVIACAKTNRTTCLGWAPSAIRRPSSVRVVHTLSLSKALATNPIRMDNEQLSNVLALFLFALFFLIVFFSMFDTRPLYNLPNDEAGKIIRGEVAQNVEGLHRPLEGSGKTGGTDNRLLV